MMRSQGIKRYYELEMNVTNALSLRLMKDVPFDNCATATAPEQEWMVPLEVYDVVETPKPVVPSASAFRCVNGESYENLRELHFGLLTMKDESFRHHNNCWKNDFASWVEWKFGEPAKSAVKELRSVHSRALTAYKIGQLMRSTRTKPLVEVQ